RCPPCRHRVRLACLGGGERRRPASRAGLGAGGHRVRIPDFKLERYFARWEFSAPYLLCTSDIEGWRMSELLALADPEARARWESLTLGYTESTGLPALREAISGLYPNLAAEQVLT